MKNIRKFYGEIVVKVEKIDYEKNFYEFIVEYYKIFHENSKKNGIEVIKKIKIENDEIIERKEVDDILDSEEKADKLLEILKRNKVTPIALKDVIDDLFKM